MIDLRAILLEARAHLQADRLTEAEHLGRQVLDAEPEQIDALRLLGAVAHRNAQFDIAVDYFERVLRRGGDRDADRNNLALVCMQHGAMLQNQGKLDEAIARVRRAVALAPADAEAHNALGIALREAGQLDDAVASYRQALDLVPGHAEAANNLANALKSQGQIDEALARYHQAFAVYSDRPPSTLSNLLFAFSYHPDFTAAKLVKLHKEYERFFAAPLRGEWRELTNRRDPERCLRLGFVSRDFVRHPVTSFLIPVLEHIDRQQCETVCYSSALTEDAMSARCRAAATHWRNVASESDAALAERIRADCIDILFDLAGHTAGNRLPVFARKPAPIQITWAGYVGTTGLAAMDYILADRHEIPPGAEVHYRERVLRMPHGYVCFDPPRDAPAVSTLPALSRVYATFGSFNNPAKFSDVILAAWAKILSRVPQSRMFFQYRGMDSPSVMRRIATAFEAHGVPASRLEFRGKSRPSEMLAAYGDVDLALDTKPYSGGLTTCEALWMGVPVVTCPGDTFASRHSLSHLSNVGLTETIAHNLDEYVEIAVAMANDLPRLAAFRAGLRERVAASPLCDGPRFAADQMAILRGVWREWCARVT